MKKVFSSIVFYGFLSLVLLLSLAALFQEVFDMILKIGCGSFIIGILLAPFVVVGVINIVRGFFAVIEKDGEKFYGKKDWKAGVYLLITIAGYAAVFYVVAQWINK